MSVTFKDINTNCQDDLNFEEDAMSMIDKELNTIKAGFEATLEESCYDW